MLWKGYTGLSLRWCDPPDGALIAKPPLWYYPYVDSVLMGGPIAYPYDHTVPLTQLRGSVLVPYTDKEADQIFRRKERLLLAGALTGIVSRALAQNILRVDHPELLRCGMLKRTHIGVMLFEDESTAHVIAVLVPLTFIDHLGKEVLFAR